MSFTTPNPLDDPGSPYKSLYDARKELRAAILSAKMSNGHYVSHLVHHDGFELDLAKEGEFSRVIGASYEVLERCLAILDARINAVENPKELAPQSVWKLKTNECDYVVILRSDDEHVWFRGWAELAEQKAIKRLFRMLYEPVEKEKGK